MPMFKASTLLLNIIVMLSSIDGYGFDYYDRSKCAPPRQVYFDQTVEVNSIYLPFHRRNQGIGKWESNTCSMFSSSLLLHYFHNKLNKLEGSSIQAPSIVDIIGQYKNGDLVSVSSGNGVEVLQKIRSGGYIVAEDSFRDGKGDFERVFDEKYGDLPIAIIEADKGNLRPLNRWVRDALSPPVRDQILKDSQASKEFTQSLDTYLKNPPTAAYLGVMRNPLQKQLRIPTYNIRYFDLVPFYGESNVVQLFMEKSIEWLKTGFRVIMEGANVGFHSTSLVGLRRACCGSRPGNGECHTEMRVFDSLPGNQAGDHWYEMDKDFLAQNLIQILPCSRDPSKDPGLPSCDPQVEGLDQSKLLLFWASTDDVEKLAQALNPILPGEKLDQEIAEEAVSNSALKVTRWMINHNRVSSTNVLTLAVKRGKFNIARDLINGMDAPSSTGFYTTLARLGVNHLQIFRLLFEKGVRFNLLDQDGRGMMSDIINNGDYSNRVEIIKFIAAHGGLIKNERLYGNPPLTASAIHGYSSFVKVLCEAGADPEIKNNEGLTTLDALRIRIIEIQTKLDQESNPALKSEYEKEITKLNRTRDQLLRTCRLGTTEVND